MKHKKFQLQKHFDQLIPLLTKLRDYHQNEPFDTKSFSQFYHQVLKQYPKNNKGYFSKSDLLAGYHELVNQGHFSAVDDSFTAKLKTKPIRTLSGVTPITVLTKPFPCPGKCIFCPNDIRMPKSYIASEPGAQRAEKNYFNPYLQTYNRLLALKQIGHPVNKAELIVLGGTWSCYPLNYKLWFISSCFQALNDFGQGIDNRSIQKPSIVTREENNSTVKVELKSNGLTTSYNQAVSQKYIHQENSKRLNHQEMGNWETLTRLQLENETSPVRCVGLVLETRPDYISQTEVITLRRLGCTKTQIGLQSLQDNVLTANKRGHDVKSSRHAMRLLRQAGLKIHVHWMPNLYGSTPQKDCQDYLKLFQDSDFMPDELKIYPCSLIADTELTQLYNQKKWRPYTQAELLKILRFVYANTPRYCRLTRIIRDIPGTEILVGNKITNLRQLAENDLSQHQIQPVEIRSREIKAKIIDASNLKLKQTRYQTSVSTEYFIEYTTTNDQIAGFLRLSLPTKESYILELKNAAIIREVHVYGQALGFGQIQAKTAQHSGLGKSLIARATQISQKHNYHSLAVISAVGTRRYYQKLGFIKKDLYQHLFLTSKTNLQSFKPTSSV